MNSGEKLGWESLLHSDAPQGCVLQAALFTTYDRADERLLVENILPSLLKLNHEPDGEGTERSYFLLELDDRLKKLHDRIVVISSTLREESGNEEKTGGDNVYSWIWRSIRQLTVGRHGKAVQHAKLWLLHWTQPEEGEFLEIIVSSANLTSSAFKQQIQAAWRVCLRLQPQRSTIRLNDWGILPDFIRELSLASVGDPDRLDAFVELLARAECPQGITFVASVPGKHTRQELRRTPWGASGLRKITPAGRGLVSAFVLSPFIGSWNNTDLQQWCANFEGSPDRISLTWIDRNHFWAKNWLLPAFSLDTLIGAGAKLLQLRYEPNDSKSTDFFHKEQKANDDRWSHAKVYAFSRGNSRRLLLTSANFSKAAWGEEKSKGVLSIENFELGVCIDQAEWPLKDLVELERENAATSTSKLIRNSSLISWAQASWSGKLITVECKCEHDIGGRVVFRDGKPLPINKWLSGPGGLHTAKIRWVDTKRLPASVLLSCKSETLSVAVFDERQLEERESSIPSGVDEADIEAMRDQLLFERYGGHIVFEEESQSDDPNQNIDLETDLEEYAEGKGGQSDSYAVDTFVSARRHLQVIDNWVDQVNQAKRGSGEFVLQILQRDGCRLFEAFNRQAKRNGKDELGARLAAEELELRLKHFD